MTSPGGGVPGYWASSRTEKNDELTYNYQFGVPTVPLVTNEVTTTSLVSILQSRRDGLSVAALAEPRLARDPWESDATTLSTWHVGASLRALSGPLSPTLVYPVPGQEGSHLDAGQTVTASYRYIVSPGSWEQIAATTMTDPYGVRRYLQLARAEDSLSHRIHRMHDFIVLPDSKWHTWEYQGKTLGAESGKPSDVGAMWMMAKLTDDPIIINDRLPYVRNYKLAQQDSTSGPFGGAALGEYFKDNAFVSEIVWAGRSGKDYVSPIFTTFYTLADVGNILLFDSDDVELKTRLRAAADKLASWQHADGSFDVGYVRDSPTTLKYPQLKDYRATWYGFLCAHRVLGDSKYLKAARRGADWFIANAVATGNYLGVCDDTHLVRDFAVIFAAQAQLDLYDVTHESRYRSAAVTVARQYLLHIYDHPTPTTKTKTFHGTEMPDWKTSQVGLNFEHAGYDGSANRSGPILLASHAGAFVRFYEITHQRIFLDLARAAARGRDAFVDPESGIPSYYWKTGNTGARQFPWHIWWHIGWVTDYLVQEAHMRSGGKISFSGGFCTAKVGSHRPYGFTSGIVLGQKADLFAPRNLVAMDEPDVDWLTARSADGKRLFVIAFNQTDRLLDTTATLDPRAVEAGKVATWRGTRALMGRSRKTGANAWKVSLGAGGLTVVAIDLSLADDPEGPELRGFTVSGEYLAPSVTWSFFATVTSWAQWRVQGDSQWHDSASEKGYTFSTTLDLKGISTPVTIEVRIATKLPDGGTGYSDAKVWKVPKVYEPDGPNIALNRPVDVSSVYEATYQGSKAADGNASSNASRWLSAVNDATPTIVVTLASTTTPKLVRVISGPDDQQRVVSFDVQVRSGSAEWTTVGSVADNRLQTVGVALEEKLADQVRLRITKRSRDQIDVARILEFEVYDKVK
ncbi:MAG: discoidin domain-containing protein [Acidipropionibacterium acidipropionici]|uniref:discoidin domain-containing protein n=1 Tax=Acidipropionibacterium acidipropionici TaxID=1748 RepID=UPI002F35698D